MSPYRVGAVARSIFQAGILAGWLATGMLGRLEAQFQDVRHVSPETILLQDPVSGGGDGYYRLAVSSDGRILAARDRDNRIDLLELPSCRLLARFEGHRNWVNTLLFSPDQRYLIALSEGETGKLICWEIASGEMAFEIAMGGETVSFSSDGERLRVGSKGMIRTFEFPSGQLTATSPMPDPGDEIVALARSGEFAISRRKITDQIARTQIHNLRSQSTVVFDGPADVTRAVAISPDERWVAAVYHHSQKVCWWSRELPREVHFEGAGHQKNLHSVSFTTDNRFLIATSWDHTASLWELATGTPVAILSGHRGRIMAAIHNPAAETVLSVAASAEDHSLRSWALREILFEKSRPIAPGQPIDFDRLAQPEISRALPLIGSLLATDSEEWLTQAQLRLDLDPQRNPADVLRAIDQLDSPSFAERQSASRLLGSHRAWVEQLLRGRAAESLTAEQKYRLGKLDPALRPPSPQDQQQILFAHRLILALELSGSQAAGQLLQQIAAQHRESSVMAEAQAALDRLKAQPD